MIADRQKIVIDTNLILSTVFTPGRTPSLAASFAFRHMEVVGSEQTLCELERMLESPKVSIWLGETRGKHIFQALKGRMTIMEAAENFKLCPDPADNKFVDLAIAARAGVVLSGDPHLLNLKNIAGISHRIDILTPAVFLRDVQRRHADYKPICLLQEIQSTAQRI